MEVALKNEMDLRLEVLMSNFKLENVEKVVMQMFEDAAKSNRIYYIGEMNKNDAMF
ncbi:hypothetical protein IJ674_07180 [bacterium]|jgi:hypothetical protein|nr:hypothetical protein [bacterium]